MKSVSAYLMILFVTSFIFIFVSPAAQYDSEVYQVQKALKSLGYNPGPLDGLWGESTRNAIEQYQRDSGLPITGILDHQTKSKLGIISSERGVKPLNETKEGRQALVIGNSKYVNAPLRNPANDAEDIAVLLGRLGFQVTKLLNATQREIEQAINTLGRKLRDGGVGLFYFAGHGVQVNGINYLIPIRANIETEGDVKYEAVNANRVLSKMQDAGNPLNMVFLDACRNNPYVRRFRSPERGLAPMEAPKGSFVAYATAPGDVADEGRGRNGVFTKHLLRYMQEPGIEIARMMRKVRVGVQKDTGDRQTPFEVSSLTGDFYFNLVSSEKGGLYVNTEPEEAFIRILNIKEKFFQGMELERGSYHVEVAAEGYETERRWIELVADNEEPLKFELVKIERLPNKPEEETHKDPQQITPHLKPEDILDYRTLRVGLDTFVPWAMKDKDGSLIGFEVDVAKKLGSDMGIEVEFFPTRWAGIIPSLISKKFDVIIAGMSITENRKKKVNFTIPYYYSGNSIVANKKLSYSYKKLDDFNQSGVTIFVRPGTTSEAICKKLFPNARIRRYEDESQMIRALINGKAHAAVVNEVLAAFQAIKYSDHLFTPISEVLDPVPVGMAVRKEDKALLNLLNSWIAKSETKKWLSYRHQYWFKTLEWEGLLSKSN